MKIRLLAAIALALVIPAAARAQSEAKPAAPAFDPVGKYAVSAVVQGNAADFTIVIEKKDDGSYGGVMENPNYGTSVISGLQVEGRTLKITLASAQGFEVMVEVTVAEDGTVDGQWSMQGDGGKVVGKKNGTE